MVDFPLLMLDSGSVPGTKLSLQRLVRGCNNAEETLNEKNRVEDNLHHLIFVFLKACQSANLNGSKEAHKISIYIYVYMFRDSILCMAANGSMVIRKHQT